MSRTCRRGVVLAQLTWRGAFRWVKLTIHNQDLPLCSPFSANQKWPHLNAVRGATLDTVTFSHIKSIYYFLKKLFREEGVTIGITFFWLTWPPLPLYSISNMWQKTYAASQFLQPIYVIVCSTWKHNNHNATAQDFKHVIHRFKCIHNQLTCIRNTQLQTYVHDTYYTYILSNSPPCQHYYTPVAATGHLIDSKCQHGGIFWLDLPKFGSLQGYN